MCMIEFLMKPSTTGKALFFYAAILVSACSSQLRYPALPQTGIARTPDITYDSASSTASMDITVLIYNVAGLPWPLVLLALTPTAGLSKSMLAGKKG